MKKIMLIAAAVAALTALTASAAQAHYLWVGGAGTIAAEGEISSVASSGVTSGPCLAEFSGSGSNTGAEGQAHGTIEAATVNAPCPTNLPGCEVESVTTNLESGGSWTLTTHTTDPEIEIHNVTFTNTYSAGCAQFGLVKISAAGTVTATFDPETQCITLNPTKDDMAVEGAPQITVDLEGEACLTEGELE